MKLEQKILELRESIKDLERNLRKIQFELTAKNKILQELETISVNQLDLFEKT